MALKYVGKLITDTQVFAMSEGITTTTYNIQKKSSLAVQKNDGERTLYIVQAGTPVPSNDGDCIGIVFENWDVTDNGGPIPIALSGTINEVNAAKLGITYAAACKAALKNVNFMGDNMDSGAMILLEAAPQTTAAAYAHATGLTYTLTLTGDTFVDNVADKPINWIVNVPAGLYVDSITKTSTTVYSIVIKALDSSIVPPADGRVTFGVLEQALTNGNTPNAAICDIYDV
jgi:hypothetical protein